MTPTKHAVNKRKPVERELKPHTLVLRVEAALRADIERLAKTSDTTLGETVRQLLHEGLALTKPTRRAKT